MRLRANLRARQLEERRRAEQTRQAQADELEEIRQRYQASLLEFTRFAWAILEPGPLVVGRDTDAIIQHAEAFMRGEIPRLGVNVQPGSGKTVLFTVIPDAWRKTWDPGFQLITCSNSDLRAAEHSLRTRELILSPQYQALWPTELKRGRAKGYEFETTSGGKRVALNFNGKLQGPGGLAQIADDPQTEADMWSPTTLRRHRARFFGGWMSRLRDKERNPSAIIAQRLGPWDLPNILRVEQPNVWEWLALEGRKTSLSMGTYYRRAGNDVETVEMPLVDTSLSRDGRFVDDRAPGDILSSRTPVDYLDRLEKVQPEVYHAQHQQSPILHTGEGAKVYSFDRAKHLLSFAKRMQRDTLPEAIAEALRTGWRVTTGWDHGVDARREICVVLLWHPILQEMWVVGCYANTGRTTPEDDARGVRQLLDSLGIPIRAVTESQGDVGSLGKNAADNVARDINTALYWARDKAGLPILGFPIATVKKGPGSVENGTNVLNVAFAGGSLFLDASCAMLAGALEGWTGGEQLKDLVDALRYGAVYRLESWQVVSGVQ